MKIAFLFLTYDNPLFPDKIKYLCGNNIFIHPKYPDKVNDYFKKYIIDDLIETEWADYSLVQATINLLEASLKHNYDYYILLSEDVYPLYEKDKFDMLFDKIYNKNLSVFDYKGEKEGLFKTSQWWMLSFIDANIIVSTKDKYKNMKYDKIFGAPDELYFLTVLLNEIPDYNYISQKIIYTKWLKNVISKHPIIFNKLMSNDCIDLAKNGSLFIRKIIKSFDPIIHKPKKNLYIIFIGTETNQDNIKVIDFNETDIIIITPLELSNIKHLDKSIYIYKIIWKFYNDIVKLILKDIDVLLWSNIYVTPEKCTFDNMTKTKHDKYGNVYFIK
jgi:hypothetical protein